LYHNIPKVDELASSSDYNLFRDGIFPQWEDPENKEGGKWLLMVNDVHQLTQHWLDSVSLEFLKDFICAHLLSKEWKLKSMCINMYAYYCHGSIGFSAYLQSEKVLKTQTKFVVL
jgi:hypothetical protein